MSKQTDLFHRILFRDLLINQDLDSAPAAIDECMATVEWYAANDPESNVVEADDVRAFLTWVRSNRVAISNEINDQLADEADDGCEDW